MPKFCKALLSRIACTLDAMFNKTTPRQLFQSVRAPFCTKVSECYPAKTLGHPPLSTVSVMIRTSSHVSPGDPWAIQTLNSSACKPQKSAALPLCPPKRCVENRNFVDFYDKLFAFFENCSFNVNLGVLTQFEFFGVENNLNLKKDSCLKTICRSK